MINKLPLTCLIIIAPFFFACGGPVKNDLPKEKDHPKFIKTIGNPRYGNVQCILQDKAGNLWFGTTFSGGVLRIIEDKNGNLWLGGDGGFHRYDGKSFTRFTIKDGLATPWVWSILEDRMENLSVGKGETGLYLYDGNKFINYLEYKP